MVVSGWLHCAVGTPVRLSLDLCVCERRNASGCDGEHKNTFAAYFSSFSLIFLPLFVSLVHYLSCPYLSCLLLYSFIYLIY
jgi:hypothetical protein